MFKSCIRVVCGLIALFMATHALSRDLLGWSDKTVCRLVKSNGGADYLEEAASRGLDCEAKVKASVCMYLQAFVYLNSYDSS